jgi:hypothetical protein
MHVLREFFKGVWNKRINNEYDHFVVVLADEGDGKSTLIAQVIRWWQQFRGVPQSPGSILGCVAWNQDEFREMMADAEERSAISAMDAARVLNKSKAQHGEQKDIIEDLFDVRTKEHLFLMGYQEWRAVPTPLQDRRAKNVLHIPKRGVVRGYNREAIDHRNEYGEWPEPQLTCRFPALDGEPLWNEFKQLDKKHKRDRMRPDDNNNESEESFDAKEIAQDVVESPEQFISRNTSNKVPYINADLIEVEYDLTQRQAKKVKSVVEKHIDIEHAANEAARGAGTP